MSTSKKALLVFATVLSIALPCQAADSVLLWPQGAPGKLGDEDKDKPSITPYLLEPATSRRGAIVVFPGGGYAGLAPYEGKDYALFFNQAGLQAFVVKYRLGSHGYRHPRMLEDAARAVRWVRSKAHEYGIDPEKIGVIGSSAGGHLVSTLVTQFDAGNKEAADPIDRLSSRPNFGILCYPVISMSAPFMHGGSRNNLLGPNPDPALVWEVSSELHVKPATPPCFIWHTLEDAMVPVENSIVFAEALRKAGVPFDLHVYQKGRHGIGLGNGHPWTADCVFWLKENGFIPAR